eukprot:783637-Rhodomonas_salina.2
MSSTDCGYAATMPGTDAEFAGTMSSTDVAHAPVLGWVCWDKFQSRSIGSAATLCSTEVGSAVPGQHVAAALSARMQRSDDAGDDDDDDGRGRGGGDGYKLQNHEHDRHT